MKEHFSFEIPRSIFVGDSIRIILSILIAFVVVSTTIGMKSMAMSIICLLILSFLFYIVLGSFGLTHTGLSMDSTTYPAPPRLGLDGVSVQNRLSGM